ncbi:MAG: hypothetical protein COZ69_15145, partial [Deltaproteobacteria bacterium CG_4_8_14_3_um_filter_45_9]
MRKPGICLPNGHKKARSSQGRENGKRESLKTQVIFCLSLKTPNVTKSHYYTKFAFFAIIWKIRNRIKNFIEFYRQHRKKVVKK